MTLQDSVDAWYESATRVVTLLRTLPPDAWPKPTDCPRWTVHGVTAHLAAIEAELAEGEGTSPDGAINAVSDAFTQRGVDARAEVGPGELVAELEDAVETRRRELIDLDVDPDATPERTPGGIGWSWKRLLSNRAVDMWTHEQDIREAVGVPGGTDGDAAAHTVAVFRTSLPYVLGKRVAPPAGTTVRWTVNGHGGFDTVVRVDDDGRAREVEGAADPTTHIELSQRAFTRLSAGRRTWDELDVAVDGDEDLARTVLEQMSVIG